MTKQKQIDKRIVKTKTKIRETLYQLLEEKGFKGISVRNLTDKANINRGTFYIHYRDIDDLLEQCENEMINQITEMVKDSQKVELSKIVFHLEKNKPLPLLLTFVNFLYANAAFFKTIIGPQGNPAFQLRLKEIIRSNMLDHLTDLNEGEMLVPMNYLISYVSSAHLGVIQHWLENGLQETPTEIALILSRLTILGPGSVVGLK
jgi:AcrR family transcriptional regulator